MSRRYWWLLCGGAALLGCDGRLALFSRRSSAEAAAGGVDGGAGSSIAVGGVAGDGESGAGGAGGAELGGGPDGAAGEAGASPSGGLWVDDFEDRDTRAASPLGWWYKVNDGTGTQTFTIEPSTGKESGAYALRSQGASFTAWGAIVGVNFAGASAIDARGLTELRFWALVAPAADNQLTLELIGAGEARFSTAISALREGWARYRVPLADFKGKDDAPLDAAMLQSLQFSLAPSDSFDFWLDDVELTP